MPRTVDISKLRADLFTLFDQVLQREGESVVVERRGSPGRAVLTSERYFLALEQELETLRRAFVALRQASPAARFRLFESGQLHVDADEVLARSRARQAERIAEKRAKFR